MTEWFAEFDPDKDAETVRLAIKAFKNTVNKKLGPQIKHSQNGLRLCQECNKEFKPTHNCQVTCSDKCKLSRKKKKQKVAAAKRKKKVEAESEPPICIVCGKLFERARRSQICSESCRKEQCRRSSAKYYARISGNNER